MRMRLVRGAHPNPLGLYAAIHRNWGSTKSMGVNPIAPIRLMKSVKKGSIAPICTKSIEALCDVYELSCWMAEKQDQVKKCP